MLNSTPLSGAVGEPARTCILQATNDDSAVRRAVVRVTAANLCPSHGAFASLLVDADPRTSCANLNSINKRIETEVQPGEHVVLVVEMVSLHNGVMCIRLGETEFQLELLPEG
jgi:hypothetical protein